MAVLYFDSSALIKRYIKETGTAWVLALLSPKAGNDIYVARIAGVEVISAIARRVRGGSLMAVDAANAISRFSRHFQRQYNSIEMISDVLNEAMLLADRHALRGYDAVQLAAALEVNKRSIIASFPTITVISADQALNDAALAEGLIVDDPNTH